VLISALVFFGPEHELLAKGSRRQLALFCSQDVVEEVAEVLRRKFPANASRLVEFLGLAGVAIIPRTAYAPLIKFQNVRDTADRHVLAAAISCRADFLATGDKDLLCLVKKGRMRIVKAGKIAYLL